MRALLLATALLALQAQATECTPATFSVEGVKSRRDFDYLVFTGTVRNSGALPCGVQLKLSTYDKAGAVVDTASFWPASVRNIPPGGAENFKYSVRFDSTATNYDAIPINAKAWTSK